MSNLSKYYISRIIIAMAMGALAIIFGASWPVAIGFVVGALAVFLYLPKSGRYIVLPENSVAPFRTDEYSQAIREKAARDGFVVLSLGFFLIHAYAQVAKVSIPIAWIDTLFGIGWLSYLVSDFWRRRA